MAAPFYPPYVNILTALGIEPVMLETGPETRFQLSQVDRGTHSLQAVILRDGEPLQSSASVSFTLQRVHTKSPAFPRPQPLPAN